MNFMKRLLDNTDKLFLLFSIANMVGYLLQFYTLISTKQHVLNNLLNQGQGYISWLVLSVIVGIIAYYSDKRFDKWYAIQVLMGSFLLFMEKNFLAIGIVGLTFFLVILLAPVTYKSLEKIVLLCMAYLMLFMNMSIFLRVIPIYKEIELYSVKMSAFVFPLFVLGALAIYVVWDIYIKRQNDEIRCVNQLKMLVKKILIFVAITVALILSQLLTGAIFEPTNIITKVLYYIQEAFRSNTGVCTTMIQESGLFGLVILVFFLYVTADVIITQKEKMGWQYKVIGVLFLLQSLCLPQSIGVICLYMVWVLIGFWHGRSEV